MKKLILFFIIVFLGITFVYANCYEQNGSMEQWSQNDEGEPPTEWKLYFGATSIITERESETIYDGAYSCKMTWDTSQDSVVALYQDEILISPNSPYEFRVYAYDNSTSGDIQIGFKWKDNNDVIVRTYRGAKTNDENNWVLLNSGTRLAPDDAQKVDIIIYGVTQNPSSGAATLFVDFVRFCDGYGPPLDVNFASFSADYQQNSLYIFWSTYSETNNLGFNIYRSGENNLNTAEKINNSIVSGNINSTDIHYYSYEDVSYIPSEEETYYWIESVSASGETFFSEPIVYKYEFPDDNGNIPEIEIPIVRNYPNPFNPSCFIQLNLPKKSNINLDIFNVKGERVKNLFSGVSEKNNTLFWDGRDNFGDLLPSGIYFYKLNYNKKSIVKKMLLLK